MKELFKNLKIFWQFIRINIKKSMIYRINFLITLVAMILWIGLYVIFFEVLFMHIDTMAGWTKPEVLMFLGFYYLFQSFRNIFYSDGFDAFSQKLRKGQIDPFLTKPASLQIMSFFQDIRFDHLIDIAMTFLLFGYVQVFYDLNLTWGLMGLGVLLAFLGSILFYGILLTIASIIFYVDRLDGLQSIIWNVTQLSRYPRQIYTGIAKTAFQFIFPIALITSIPTEVALGTELGGMLIYFVLMTLFILGLGNICFHIGIKRYNSAN